MILDAIAMKPVIYGLIFTATALFVWAAAIIADALLKEYEEHYVSDATATLGDMFIFMDPQQLLVINMAIIVISVTTGLLFTYNIVTIILCGIFGYAFPKLLIWYLKQKRFQKFAEQLVDSLMVLANSLRAGLSLIQAIETLEEEQEPPISQEFGLVLREVRLGVPVGDALKNLTKRVPNDDLMLMVTSMNIVIGMGGNLREIFDTMAHVIRERSKIELKTKSLTAQGKLQALVVCLLPLGLGFLMHLIDPVMMERMVTTVLGVVSLGVMFTLQIMGYLMIRKITSIEV